MMSLLGDTTDGAVQRYTEMLIRRRPIVVLQSVQIVSQTYAGLMLWSKDRCVLYFFAQLSA